MGQRRAACVRTSTASTRCSHHFGRLEVFARSGWTDSMIAMLMVGFQLLSWLIVDRSGSKTFAAMEDFTPPNRRKACDFPHIRSKRNHWACFETIGLVPNKTGTPSALRPNEKQEPFPESEPRLAHQALGSRNRELTNSLHFWRRSTMKKIVATLVLLAVLGTSTMAYASPTHFGRVAFLKHESPSYHHGN